MNGKSEGTQPIGSVEDQKQSEVRNNSASTESAVDAASMAAMAEEVRQANERALRSQAELENFRKRIRKEMDDQLRYAALPVMRDLLPVLDNLERAFQAAESHRATMDPAAIGLLDGVKMVAGQLVSVLEKHHGQRIEAEGASFDPHLHEAIAQEPSNEVAQGHVTRVTQMGYRLHDRVLRPSQVLVSTGAPSSNKN